MIIRGVISMPNFKNRDHEAVNPWLREHLLGCLIENLVDVRDEDMTSGNSYKVGSTF